MKALTLWQPWADLAALGLKHETRSWGTSYRGPIAIHAALKDPRPIMRELPTYVKNVMFNSLYAAYGIQSGVLDRLPIGYIVGTGVLADCYKILNICHAEQLQGHLVTVEMQGRIRDIWITHEDYLFGDWTPGRYAWRLENMQKVTKPVPAKGAQGLWNWQAQE